jgi:ABC-type molybdate transport system substrate-binding protein
LAHAQKRSSTVPHWRSFVLLLLAFAGPAQTARAWTSPAPDVVLYCDAPLLAPMQEVARNFTQARGVPIHIFVSPPDSIIGLIKHRARADVVVADVATLRALAAGGAVKPESLTPLGNNPYLLIGHASIEAAPPGGLPALLAAHKTALPDPTTAASFDGAAILHESAPGIAAPRTAGFADTPDVIDAVRGDAGLIGLVQQTEARDPALKNTLHEVARLNAKPVLIMGGLVTLGQSGNAANLLAFLAGTKGQAILHASGLE